MAQQVPMISISQLAQIARNPSQKFDEAISHRSLLSIQRVFGNQRQTISSRKFDNSKRENSKASSDAVPNLRKNSASSQAIQQLKQYI